MKRFWIAPLLPAALLVMACLFGGWWSVAALISVSVLITGLDRAFAPDLAAPSGDHTDQAHQVNITLGIVHLILLPLGVWALTRGPLDGASAVATAAALGIFFGQVSNSNAHELIHRKDRLSRRLGMMIYASLLFGHHASAHPKVHHVYVATPEDPNSAPMGMGFYRYWLRAWVGSFRAGLKAENRMRARAAAANGLHPYVGYMAVSAASLAVAWAIAGGLGMGVWVGLSVYAVMQLMLSDYVQHYGLQRPRAEDGGWAPAGPQHSWNAPHWYSAAFMLNAPRHSDHHAHPSRPFPDLRLNRETMPMLPYSVPIMACIALIPPIWKRMMDKRARIWAPPTDGISKDMPPRAQPLGAPAPDLPV